MQRSRSYPIVQALLAALLFGMSAPLAKLLLGQVEPVMLAALLYLGCGLGVLAFRQTVRHTPADADAATRIVPADYRWLAGAVLAGGVAAPILLLFSLRSTPGSTASLLLNFETVATTVIAALVFKEQVTRLALWAMVCVTLASVLLSWDGSGQWGLSLGALGVLGACLLWGIDNNFTRVISAKDPLTIVTVKGIGAGLFSLILALLLGNRLPTLPTILGALGLGSLSYGLSIVLFIYALRGLGAARTSTLFSTAPLAGVLLSFLLLGETPNAPLLPALLLMFVSALLLFVERHSHQHVHDAIIHEHRHRHDDGHHNHDHPGMISRSLTHSHAHTHERLEHDHLHLPGIHHGA